MGVTQANAQDFATFLVEYERVPWAEVIATGRQYRAQFVSHVLYMLTNHHFLCTFTKVTDRAVPRVNRWKLAHEVADIILAEPTWAS